MTTRSEPSIAGSVAAAVEGGQGHQSRSRRSYALRALKGIILLAWLVTLVCLAIATLTNSGASVISLLPGINNVRGSTEAGGEFSPMRYLDRFVLEHYAQHPPPLRAVLNAVVVDWPEHETYRARLSLRSVPGSQRDKASGPAAIWKASESSVAKSSRRASDDELRMHYRELFRALADRLEVAVHDSDGQLESLILNEGALPSLFRGDTVGDIDLLVMAPGVGPWVAVERDRMHQERQSGEFFDLFLILIVLGALGSLIFLTRDYLNVDAECQTSASVFVFRPVLGMLLAIAMFVIDILAHSVLSAADVAQVRPEPLYILAFAAGLLSEQAYDLMEFYSKSALERLKEGTSREHTRRQEGADRDPKQSPEQSAQQPATST
ncbi:MAG: hypothetical protein OXR73_36510 [Myxococcales bacterium]|nr:hypothetical protein [Myxococcales bacterium]